jgi:hypothetical protein
MNEWILKEHPTKSGKTLAQAWCAAQQKKPGWVVFTDLRLAVYQLGDWWSLLKLW